MTNPLQRLLVLVMTNQAAHVAPAARPVPVEAEVAAVDVLAAAAAAVAAAASSAIADAVIAVAVADADTTAAAAVAEILKTHQSSSRSVHNTAHTVTPTCVSEHWCRLEGTRMNPTWNARDGSASHTLTEAVVIGDVADRL